MEDYQKEAVTECLTDSCGGFESLDVTDYLLRSGILGDDEETIIRNEISRRTRVQLLDFFVECKAGNTFDQLVKALMSCGKYDELDKDIEASVAHLQIFNTEVEELLQSTSPDESYIYLEMLLSLGVSLDTKDSLKVCEHLSLSDECIDSVRWSENPGLATMNFCRKTRIVKVSNVQALRDLLDSLELGSQLAIVDGYFKALEHPEIELLITKTEPGILLERIKNTLQDKITWFKVGKQIGNLFQKTYGKTFLANIELDSCFLTLKVPTRTALKYIHRDVCSERLASDVLALLLTHLQHHDLHDTVGRQNMKMTFELNEHIYQISKSRLEETEEPPIQDDSSKTVTTETVSDPSLTPGSGPGTEESHIQDNSPETLTTKRVSDPSLTTGLDPGTEESPIRDNSPETLTTKRVSDPSLTTGLGPETEESPIQDNSPKKVTTETVSDPSLTTGLGPGVTVTITKTFPDTLLASLRRTVNDRQCSHTKGRSLRIFFYQYFEDIVCTKIRDTSNGVSFFLRVKTATALHRLHTAISKGELAKEMLATVKDAVDKLDVKHAGMVMELDKEEYNSAQEFFESSTASGGRWKPFGEVSSPKAMNRGSPSSPLLVDSDSFEMIQQMFRERQEYENALSKSGKF